MSTRKLNSSDLKDAKALSLTSFQTVPLPPTQPDEEEENVTEEDELDNTNTQDDNDVTDNQSAVNFSQKLVENMKQTMSQSQGGSSSSPVESSPHLSNILAGANNFRRISSVNSGKGKQSQLLHKRLQDMSLSQNKASDIILSTNLEEMAVTTNIPQWLMYSWTSKAKDWKVSDKRTQQAIAELMLLKQYVFPVALCLTLSSSQQEQVARNLLTVFQNVHLVLERSISDSWSRDNGPLPSFNAVHRRKDHVISFLEAIIVEEVDEAKNQSTLFRSNNIISKLLTLYANQVGKEYLSGMLNEVILKVLTMGSMEVDPAKLEQQGPDALKEIYANMKRLLNATKLVLNSVVSSISKCPLGLKKLSYIIQRQVENKFGPNGSNGRTVSVSSDGNLNNLGNVNERHVAVSGFIFLRFICPAIVSPDTYGIISQTLNTNQRRSLVLISKILQNLANGVKFGSKESYMTPANSFLDENTSLTKSYCEGLINIEQDSVYWVSESPEVAAAEYNLSKPRIAELEASFEQIMGAFNTNMAKILDKIDNVQVSEVITYTVFGALKSMLKRFELIERVYDIAFGNEGSSVYHRGSVNILSHRDMELLNNFVLLGGLEEILLMNNFVLLRAMINPSNFVTGKASSILSGLNSQGSSGTFRELDIVARSAVHILAPHGATKLTEFVEWTLLQEIRMFSSDNQLSGAALRKRTSAEIVRKILEGPIGQEGKDNPFSLSISFRTIVSFCLVHVRDFLKPGIAAEVQSIWDSTLKYEIDPSRLLPDDNVKSNLDNLVSATMRIFNGVISCAKAAPLSLKRMLRNIFFHLTESASDTGKDYETSLAVVSNFLFVHVICPAVASPVFYGILPDSTRASFSSANIGSATDVHPYRTFTLISYFLRFLSGKSFASYIGAPTGTEDALQYEKEAISGIIEQWNKSSIHMVQTLIQATHPGASSGSSTPNENVVKEADPALPVSSSARAKALLYIRKMLTPLAVKHLKSIIDTQKFKDATRNLTLKEMIKQANSGSSHVKKEELSGMRVETIQYRLMDRVRIVFANLYKEPESATILKEIQSRQKQNAESGPQTGLAKDDAALGSERGRASGFVVLNNKARKGMASNTVSAHDGKDVPQISAKEPNPPAKIPHSQSRWALVTNPSQVAQATKNIVRGIFAHASKEPVDDNLDESMFIDDSDKLEKSKTKDKAEDEQDRGLISVLRQRKQVGAISPAFTAGEKKRPKIRFQEQPEYTTSPVEKDKKLKDSDSESSDVGDSGILNFEFDEEGKEDKESPAVKSKRLKRKKNKDEGERPSISSTIGRKSGQEI